MIDKCTFYRPLLELFKERVRTDSVPVEILEGEETKDYSGTFVDVLLDYSDADAYIVHKCLCDTINENYCLT